MRHKIGGPNLFSFIAGVEGKLVPAGSSAPVYNKKYNRTLTFDDIWSQINQGEWIMFSPMKYPLAPNFHPPTGNNKAWCVQVTGYKIQELIVLCIGWTWKRKLSQSGESMRWDIFMLIKVTKFPQSLLSTIRNKSMYSDHYGTRRASSQQRY
jgi:hypothetical protein